MSAKAFTTLVPARKPSLRQVLFMTFLLLSIASSSFSGTVYFRSGLESGNVSEWVGDGGGNQTGGPYVTDEKAHRGNYSWKAYNDPDLPAGDNISAKLLRWRFNHSSAYYSAWYFWPADYLVSGNGGQYVNIFQWKERKAPYDPTWVVAVKNSYVYPGEDEIVIHDWHGSNSYRNNGSNIYRNNIKLPKGRWFHLEAFFKTGRADGEITLWLDGQQIFQFTNINTSGSATNTNGFLMWGVGNYGDSGLGKYLYVDDAAVSNYRLYLPPPGNLTISTTP